MSHAKPPFRQIDVGNEFPASSEEADDAITIYEAEDGKQSQTTEIFVQGSKWQLAPCGKFFLPMDGYIRFDLEGISRSGPYFADVTHLIIIPESDWFTEQTFLKFISSPSDFYWGRRGFKYFDLF